MDLIEITPEMVAEGVEALHGFKFGDPIDEVIRHVYMMMELERRDQANAAASSSAARK